MPNEYGIAKHPLFLLGFSYQENAKKGEYLLQEQEKNATSAQYYEPMCDSLEPTVYVDNLTKTFNKKNVVNGITLRLYEQ